MAGAELSSAPAIPGPLSPSQHSSGKGVERDVRETQRSKTTEVNHRCEEPKRKKKGTNGIKNARMEHKTRWSNKKTCPCTIDYDTWAGSCY